MEKSSGAKMYEYAREQYAAVGVDTETALEASTAVPLSLHCWQGDDVGGFEKPDAVLSGGGIQVTGNYPGKARTPDELRSDLGVAASLVPGVKRLNLHASYGNFGGKPVDRDMIEEAHFRDWIAWAKEKNFGLDFNPTLFSHPKAADGFTLTHRDRSIRAFWIEHVKRTRKIAAKMGRELKNPCVNNIWIPDGAKDTPVDRAGYRERLLTALDEILAEKHPASEMLDAVEGKLFGIGSESFVVGSNDFYLGYAATRRILLTLDLGHYHPTENVADKITAVLPFVPGLLLHVSRGVRWDSDHAVILNDDLRELCFELVASGALDRIHVGLDFFDATINRIGAWSIGARSTRKALLMAYLAPMKLLREADGKDDGFARLALLERMKTLPWTAVWDEACARHGVPEDSDFIEAVHRHEREVLSKRTERQA